ncbi:serine/threonine-protein kinase nekl-2-like isoform X2 [Mytilus californianus]|uniref:serine/threonine-protein kinase nekl-2-like isoform X2 n=1 Tax=Mytilus californianus TaxID=6549 RepID=UPI00224843BD|nr:serine/threonine-protein kinase nekl-2-like isoform X2 [Mytilus californianus]
MDPKGLVGKTCGEFTVDKLIGKGTFGLVYLVTRTNEKPTCTGTYKPTSFAMKMVHTAGSNTREQTLLEREIQLLRDLKRYDHKNIVKYVDFFHYKNFTCIIMEYCERGTLFDFIREQKNKVVQEDKFVHILTQIAAGLEFLHDKHVLHRDVKSKNILISGHLDIKIADFGVAREIPIAEPGQMSVMIGSPQYMSPEMLAQKPYDHKTDMWSLGCTCYEMGTGDFAFKADSINKIKELVRNNELPPMKKADYCQNVKKLIMWMLQTESVNRPTAKQVLENIQTHRCKTIDSQTTIDIAKAVAVATDPPDSGMSSGTRTIENTLPGGLSSTLGSTMASISQSIDFQKQSCRYQVDLVRLIGDNTASKKVSKIMKVLRRHPQNYDKIKETVKKYVREDRFDKTYSIVMALKGTEEAIAAQTQRGSSDDRASAAERSNNR